MHTSLLFNASKDASWINARRLQQHLKKLQEIRSRSVQALPTTSLRHSLKGLSFLEAERLHTIKRDNRLLMRKLVSIAESRGDRHQAGSGAFRSMNLAVRRKEDDRIRADNENLGRRLVHIEGAIKKAPPVRHRYSKSYAFRDGNAGKALFKVTAMVASDSESRLNASVIEETKARQREKQDLNRSWVGLHKAHSGVTLAQYLDAKGEIAVISDVKRVKKKGNVELPGESKAKPGGNMSKSMRKLEIVRLPGHECKSTAASKPPLYAFQQVNEAIPPLQFPAPHFSQHSTPQLPSSKVRLQRQDTVFKASPPSYSQSPAALQSAPLSKQPSQASQELGELEEQYSEDQHQDEESGQTSLESDESEKRRRDVEIGEKALPETESNRKPQEAHIEIPQLPVFSAHEEEKGESNRSQTSSKEAAVKAIDSAPYELEDNAVTIAGANPKEEASPRQRLEPLAEASASESFVVGNKEVLQDFGPGKSPPLSPKEEIKADSPKPELSLPVQEDTNSPTNKPPAEPPKEGPDMDPMHSHHSEKEEKKQQSEAEEPAKSPNLVLLPTTVVSNSSGKSQSARIQLQKSADEEDTVKRRNTASHWIVPEDLIARMQVANSQSEAASISLSPPIALSAEELKPIPASPSENPPTDLPPALADQTALPNASISPTLPALQT